MGLSGLQSAWASRTVDSRGLRWAWVTRAMHMGSGFVESQEVPEPPGSWGHPTFTVMNHVEVSGDGRSLMLRSLLCCPQGEPHSAEMALISPPQNVHSQVCGLGSLQFKCLPCGTKRECRAWNSQASFPFHKAFKCLTITAGRLSWKLVLTKREQKVVPSNCRSVHMRKQLTFLHSEPVYSYFAHHPDKLRDLIPQPCSLWKE